MAAGYQLMASYLLWDLRDLLREGYLQGEDARARLRQFVEMLDAAQRATMPVYPAPRQRARSGSARAARGKRLASLGHDEQLLAMVRAARGDEDPSDVPAWVRRTHAVLQDVEGDWKVPDDEEKQRFIVEEVEPFLHRLGQIDQLDSYRPVWRAGLIRR